MNKYMNWKCMGDKMNESNHSKFNSMLGNKQNCEKSMKVTGKQQVI